MPIKEPIYGYRKYRVTANVEYIPCLPVKGVHTATRIPKGAELSFLRKFDNELSEVIFRKENEDEKIEYHVLVMVDFLCENLLPIYRR